MSNILIIDDEQEMLVSLNKILKTKDEYNVSLMSDSAAAINRVKNEKFDLVITDLQMQNYNGMDILKATLSKFPDTNVIMISGYGTIEASVEAMKEGAFDFIEKPFTSKKLLDCIERAVRQGSHVQSSSIKDKEESESLAAIIYQSKQMDEVIQLVKKVAKGNMNILISGESGTGKELIARAVHGLSKRNLNPFVPINCSALPEHLFESELFGHEKGAFTGAIKTKPGLLEFADQGTFFFDEIGDLSLNLQVKLLRMLEERKIRRVGGQMEIDIDVRIIAASNKDLARAVEEKKFREDLFYRLNTIMINIPPLRERTNDIVLLASHFMRELCFQNDKPEIKFSSEAIAALKSHPWPGNVRELQNMIGRAYYLCTSEIVQKSDLPLPISGDKLPMNNELLSLSYKNAKETMIEKFEIEYLSHHLKENKGNISKTAEVCGLDRRSIHRLIKKYDIIYRE